MPAPRTAAVVVLAALALAVLGVQACQRRSGGAAPAAPVASAAPLSAPSPVTPATPALSPGAARLEAAGTLRLFCRLLDSGRLAQAQALLAPGAWSQRELRAIRRFAFISARVHAAHARSLVLLARIRVRLRAPSPLSNGIVTLFFTLGRVGTTSGGWLITAVDTSP